MSYGGYYSGGGYGGNGTSAYDGSHADVYASSSAYVQVAAGRLVVTVVGVLIILAYKARHGVVRLTDQRKAGLPVGRGFGTALALVRFGIAAPVRGAWVAGHVLCMVANYAGAVYLVVLIASDPDSMFGYDGAPLWVRGVMSFRSIIAFVIAGASVVQIAFVLTGRYGAHRWLGRVLVRLTTASTALTLLLPTSVTAIAVVSTLLGTELALFFAWKLSSECRTVADAYDDDDSGGADAEATPRGRDAAPAGARRWRLCAWPRGWSVVAPAPAPLAAAASSRDDNDSPRTTGGGSSAQHTEAAADSEEAAVGDAERGLAAAAGALTGDAAEGRWTAGGAYSRGGSATLGAAAVAASAPAGGASASRDAAGGSAAGRPQHQQAVASKAAGRAALE